MDKIKTFTELVSAEKIFNPHGSLGTPQRLRFYLDNLFREVDLKGKTVLDVGAGYGVYSIYMALCGAGRVVSLEPELDGGTNQMVEKSAFFCKELGISTIEVRKELFQEFEPGGSKFDLILLHNSINHLNESACIKLGQEREEDAYAEYLNYFKTIAHWQAEKGMLVLADCSKRNFFGDLGLKSPIAPSIEWHKHQPPGVWAALAQSAGYEKKSLNWSTTGFGGAFEKRFLSNGFAAYFLLSHFNLKLKKR